MGRRLKTFGGNSAPFSAASVLTFFPLLLETGEDGELDDDDLSDEDDDKSSGSESDEDIYTGPPPPILKMYVDKITENIHPFDIKFVYFTRLDRGPVPEPPKNKDVDGFLNNYMLKGLMDQDPIQMLHSFLS